MLKGFIGIIASTVVLESEICFTEHTFNDFFFLFFFGFKHFFLDDLESRKNGTLKVSEVMFYSELESDTTTLYTLCFCDTETAGIF